jgi:hypothetical protein
MSNQSFENPTPYTPPPEPPAKKPFPVLGVVAIISVVLSLIVIIGALVVQPNSSTTSKARQEAAAESSDPLDFLKNPTSTPVEIPSIETPDIDGFETVDVPEGLEDAVPEKLRPIQHCFLSDTYDFTTSGTPDKVVTCGINASEHSVGIVTYVENPDQVATLREPPMSPFTEMPLKLKATEGHDIRVVGSPGIWRIIDFQPNGKALQYSMIGGNEEDVEEFLTAYELAK